MNIYAKFQLHLLIASEKKILEFFFFENLAFRLPWQPIKISDFDKIHTVGIVLLYEHFCKTFVKTEINANFHFSHYKSMETLRVIIFKHPKIAITAENDMSQIFLKLCVYFPYVQ